MKFSLLIWIFTAAEAGKYVKKPKFANYCVKKDACKSFCNCEVFANCELLPMDRNIRNTIQMFHNQVRDLQCSRDNQPNGMSLLKYDMQLEEISQCWAVRCDSQYSECFKTPKYKAVSQAIGEIILEGKEMPNVYLWMQTMTNWLGEGEAISKSTIRNITKTKFKKIHSFAQIMSDKVLTVGCAWSILKNDRWVTFVCSYGPRGPLPGESIFNLGQPCSNCPKNYSCDHEKPFEHLCKPKIRRHVTSPPRPSWLSHETLPSTLTSSKTEWITPKHKFSEKQLIEPQDSYAQSFTTSHLLRVPRTRQHPKKFSHQDPETPFYVPAATSPVWNEFNSVQYSQELFLSPLATITYSQHTSRPMLFSYPDEPSIQYPEPAEYTSKSLGWDESMIRPGYSMTEIQETFTTPQYETQLFTRRFQSQLRPPSNFLTGESPEITTKIPNYKYFTKMWLSPPPLPFFTITSPPRPPQPEMSDLSLSTFSLTMTEEKTKSPRKISPEAQNPVASSTKRNFGPTTLTLEKKLFKGPHILLHNLIMKELILILSIVMQFL